MLLYLSSDWDEPCLLHDLFATVAHINFVLDTFDGLVDSLAPSWRAVARRVAMTVVVAVSVTVAEACAVAKVATMTVRVSIVVFMVFTMQVPDLSLIHI